LTGPTFQHLSGPGAAALSIWRLRSEPADLCAFLQRSHLPPVARPTVVHLAGEAADLVDQGLLWVRQLGSDPGGDAEVQAELHLHGGYGVAAAFRRMMDDHGWRELPSSQQSLARSPLATRLQYAHSARAPWTPPKAQAELQRMAAQVRPYLAWLDLVARPPKVVLAGPPNAGKSTLFNAWLQSDRVTVSPFPGTTRDAVSARLLLGEGNDAIEATLVDTAGIGLSFEALDAQAMQLARQELKSAWKVIWVLDGATAPSQPLIQSLSLAPVDDVFLLHRHDLPAAWNFQTATWLPAGAQWVQGAIPKDGEQLIQRLQKALFSSLGPVPPVGMWLPLEEKERLALGLPTQSPARR
jgi:50S ribosome-binding GTPase